MHHLSSIEDIQDALQAQRYIAERGLATTIFLALKMGHPLFLEGEAIAIHRDFEEASFHTGK